MLGNREDASRTAGCRPGCGGQVDAIGEIEGLWKSEKAQVIDRHDTWTGPANGQGVGHAMQQVWPGIQACQLAWQDGLLPRYAHRRADCALTAWVKTEVAP